MLVDNKTVIFNVFARTNFTILNSWPVTATLLSKVCPVDLFTLYKPEEFTLTFHPVDGATTVGTVFMGYSENTLTPLPTL